jgi:gliding motility-associated-like protein
VNPASTTTYSLTITTGGCNADTTFEVAVKAGPKITLTVPSDSICTGDSANITISGGGTYLWSTGSTNAAINVKPATTSTYTATVTKNGCTKDTTITIKVNSPPVVNITGTTNICSGETITLTASGGGKYKWNTGSTTDTINVSATSGTTYSVSVFNGCTGSASATVNVDNPILFACCDTLIESGNSTHLSSSGGNIVKYVWTPSTGLNCDTCANVIATPTISTTYTVIGTDSLGCTIERTVVVIVEPTCANIIVPNVFTPNGDTKNDVFEIMVGQVSSYSIFIYDRWGKEMYKSTDPTKSWEGTTEGGSIAPDGVYFYIIQSTCNSKTYKYQGYVQVIR